MLNAIRPKTGIVLAAIFAGGTLLAACADREVAGPCDSDDGLLEASRWTRDETRLVDVSSAEEALQMFAQGQNRPQDVWNGVRPVPRVLAKSLPADLENLDSIAGRKRAFVAIVLPLALRANEEIRVERHFVERALACGRAGKPLSVAARDRLRRLYRAYEANRDAEKLLDRLDTVPPSLIVAQAAIESGWGTSRFAQEGNALFGQRTTRRDRAMKATGVTDGTEVHVAAFPHLLASVRSYIHTLNTHGSYNAFRSKRSARREVGWWPNGMGIAKTMVRYSERGPAYVSELNAIIRGNDFVAFDEAHLEPTGGREVEGS